MLVRLWIIQPHSLDALARGFGKPRVFVVVDPADKGISRRIDYKPLVDKIVLEARVENDPVLRAFPPQRCVDDLPFLIRQKFGFFGPVDIDPFQSFYFVDVSCPTVKDELGAGRSVPDRRRAYLEFIPHPEAVDGVNQDSENAVRYPVLELPCRQYSDPKLGCEKHGHPGCVPGLCRIAAPVQDAVSDSSLTPERF